MGPLPSPRAGARKLAGDDSFCNLEDVLSVSRVFFAEWVPFPRLALARASSPGMTVCFDFFVHSLPEHQVAAFHR
jgi:hypothetical protein